MLQSVPDCGGVRPSARSDALTPYEQVYLSDGSASRIGLFGEPFMECEDIINKKFNRSFIGYDIGQVDAFLDELYSEMQALKAELEMLRAARQMNSDSKPKHGPEENSKTADEQ